MEGTEGWGIEWILFLRLKISWELVKRSKNYLEKNQADTYKNERSERSQGVWSHES